MNRLAINAPEARVGLISYMETHPQRVEASHFPTTHEFTPGLYTRTVELKAGDRVLSKVHRTEHPFFILKGVVQSWSPGAGWTVVQSPYRGVTRPGEWRAVVAVCDTVWSTVHATDKTDVAEIERDLFE